MDHGRACEALQGLRSNIGRVFVGAAEVVDHLLVGLLTGGHVLIQDVPGVGKTTLARALARSLDCSFRRIQFTPDLLPSDVTGVSIYDPRSGAFRFVEGPVFASVVLADEINRTPPRTQAALLEAMSEEQVSVDGEARPLPAPFIVLATMNPLEHHGTYDLPESQLDRFLLRLQIGYPDREGERRIFQDQKTGHPLHTLTPVLTTDDVLALQGVCRDMRFEASLEDYVLDIIAATRQHPEVLLGASPRATLALSRAAQARALLAGRQFVIPDDIKEMAAPVLAHRLGVRNPAGAGGGDDLVQELLASVSVPR